jgi:hypothetical protein
MTSVLNSSIPCPDVTDSLLTAISFPPGKLPCTQHKVIKQTTHAKIATKLNKVPRLVHQKISNETFSNKASKFMNKF